MWVISDGGRPDERPVEVQLATAVSRRPADGARCQTAKNIYAAWPTQCILFGRLGLFRSEHISANMDLEVLQAAVEPPLVPGRGLIGNTTL